MTSPQSLVAPWWGDQLLREQPDDAVWARTRRDVTWAELRDRVEQSIGIFVAHGIGPGSSVALRLPPSLTGIWSLLALWSLGAQVQLLDHRLKPAEVQRILDLCEPRYYVHFTDRAPALFQDECEVYVQWRRGGREAVTGHCLVQFSSGSTGRPKVIGRTSQSLRAELQAFSSLDAMPRRGERVLLLNSTIHSLGLIGGVLHAMNTGATLVFASSLQVDVLLRTLAEEEIDAVFGVPFHYDLLGRAPAPPALPHLRLAVSGGERLTQEVHERFSDRYGIRIGQAYGMTETGIIATDLPGEFAPPTVGRVVPGVRTRITEGKLWISLDHSPYLQDEGTDRYVDGWLNSHDLAGFDENTGALRITGRSDTLVAVGGLKVDLMEIENELAQHPAVREIVVVQSNGIEAHIGAPDGLTASELLAFARERLSSFKIPRRIHIGPELPRTANGKLLRTAELIHAAYAASGRPRGPLPVTGDAR
ncbi:class I adenylate-forming enzyme family protein [Streptomyces sp. CNQ085]|uniref:class I adenylate-forming enzyme family protein n=1 Tax=Streptomyces sp. CNQ085 TaxID=2886944 RepID=UPI001F514E15|nr:class I adenylate-forming enzyme family protein [Streptomyces sp. CNQ085]MCI0386308.1 acyl--CoA ligase [Streptomyces sp. CNQ085]